jgi:hypothetical protein
MERECGSDDGGGRRPEDGEGKRSEKGSRAGMRSKEQEAGSAGQRLIARRHRGGGRCSQGLTLTRTGSLSPTLRASGGLKSTLCYLPLVLYNPCPDSLQSAVVPSSDTGRKISTSNTLSTTCTIDSFPCFLPVSPCQRSSCPAHLTPTIRFRIKVHLA